MDVRRERLEAGDFGIAKSWSEEDRRRRE